MKRYASFFAILSALIVCSAHGAQQPITTITSGTGTSGKTLKQYNDNDITPRLTNINDNFTDLYTNKAGVSCFANSTAFNTCFPLDWPTGFDTAGDYTVTGAWDFTGATVTGISGSDGIDHATSDGNYYASRNGSWASLTGVFASPLGLDDNYVTDAEKTKLGNLSGTNTGDQDLSSYATSSAVLTKTNTTSFIPSGDYHPATKKYVDDSITAGGGYTDEQAQDAAGGMFSGNTETGITVTYNDTTGKVDFVVATQSDVNFTSTLNTKLAGIATGAEVNVNADWNSSSGDSQILNKPTETPISASIVTNLFTGTGDCLGKNGQAVDCGGSGASALADITDWPSGLTATELGYANGVTGPIQSQIDAISAGGIPHVASGYPSTSGAWNFNTTDYKLYTRLANGSVYSTASLTSVATADVTPEGFAFTDVIDATLSTEYTACDQVTGIDWPATVTASSNAVAICTGNNTGCGTFGTSPGTVENNGWVCARHTSSASNSTATNTPVTVGTVSDTFTSTTVAGVSYLINEGFEGTGQPSNNGGVTWGTGGTVNYDYTTTVLNGSQSVLINQGASNFVSVAFSSQASLYTAFAFRVPTVYTTGTEIVSFSDGTNSSSVFLHSNGRYLCRVNGTSAYSDDAAYTNNTKTYLKVLLDTSTDVLTAYSSTDGSTWGQVCTVTGAGMSGVTSVQLVGGWDGNIVVDDLKVSISDISW